MIPFFLVQKHTASLSGVMTFEPEFQQLHMLRADIPGVPMLAVTATAPPRVRQEILVSLQVRNLVPVTVLHRRTSRCLVRNSRFCQLRNPVLLVSTFNRPNIHYEVHMCCV